MLSINDLKLGTIIKLEGSPYMVQRLQHVKMGRGGAILRTKLKNLITGNVLEKNFKGGDKFEEVILEKSKANFLYKEGKNFYFMMSETFEQFFFDEQKIGHLEKFLKEGLEIDILKFDGLPQIIELPKKIKLRVKAAPPGIRGDTSQSPTKSITLETELVVNAPLFIKEGDIVIINTETGEYVERA